MKPVKKQTAEIFFFGVVFICCLAMVFSLVKQVNSPAYKAGVKLWSEMATRNVR